MLVVGRDTGAKDALATRFCYMRAPSSTGIYSVDAINTRLNGIYANNGANTSASALLADPPSFACLVGTMAQTGLTSTTSDNPTLDNMTGGVTAFGSLVDGYARVPAGVPFLLGSFATNYAGSGDEVLATLWTRIPSSAEIALAYKWVKAVAATKGISI